MVFNYKTPNLLSKGFLAGPLTRKKLVPLLNFHGGNIWHKYTTQHKHEMQDEKIAYLYTEYRSILYCLSLLSGKSHEEADKFSEEWANMDTAYFYDLEVTEGLSRIVLSEIGDKWLLPSDSVISDWEKDLVDKFKFIHPVIIKAFLKVLSNNPVGESIIEDETIPYFIESC